MLRDRKNYPRTCALNYMTIKLVLFVCLAAVRACLPRPFQVCQIDANSLLDAYYPLFAALALVVCPQVIYFEVKLVGFLRAGRSIVPITGSWTNPVGDIVAQWIRIVVVRGAKEEGKEAGERASQRWCAGADDTDC